MKTIMYRLGVHFDIALEREIFLLLCRGEGVMGMRHSGQQVYLMIEGKSSVSLATRQFNVRHCCSDLEVMLQSSDFEKPPENSEMSTEFIKELDDCSTGSVAFVYEEKGEVVL